MKDSIGLGRVVLSRAGRDAGRYFVVIGLAGEEYALIADGALRKIAKPKKKKMKHLEAKPDVIEDIRDRWTKQKFADSDIRRYLKDLGYINEA